MIECINNTSATKSMWKYRFRLSEIQKLLAEYGQQVIYEFDEAKRVVRIKFSETFPDELKKEIADLISEHYHNRRNMHDAYHDVAIEVEFTNRTKIFSTINLKEK